MAAAVGIGGGPSPHTRGWSHGVGPGLADQGV